VIRTQALAHQLSIDSYYMVSDPWKTFAQVAELADAQR